MGRPLIPLGVAVVRGRSMLPTLRAGDRLLVRYGARPAPGRIAVLRLPDGTVAVKRLADRDGRGWAFERDNPVEGVDSWAVGPVPDDGVLGLVLARLWPHPGRVSAAPQSPYDA
jgi:hypothetical protein